MKRQFGLAAALLGIQIALGAAWAASDQPTEVSTRLRRAALFKNGLGFFVREGTLPGRAGPLVVKPLPAAAHGTFWLSYPADAGVRDVAAREDVLREPMEAISLAELLRANVGKKVVLWISGDDKAPITGTVVAFPTDRKPPRPDPYAAGPARVPDERYRGYPAPANARLVLIETDQGVTAVDPNLVRRLDFPGGDAARQFHEEQPTAALHARLEKPSRDREFTVSYLSKGMTWAPSYMVDISDPKTACLSAKAMIMNEVEDLEGARLDLVTGFPNLLFSDVTSPIALNQTLAQFLGALGGRSEEQRRRSVVTQQAAVANYGEIFDDRAARGVAPAYSTAAAGWQAEDLFLYPLENVTLAKGEVGYYGLFTEEVPYRHVYQWEIPDYVSEEDRYGQARREERDQPEVVWHCLRLKNTMRIPWTTAPAETVQKDQVLGQDILRYTNAGSEAVLKITQALAVKAEQRELEIERDREAVRMYHGVYDRVTIKGELRVQNFKPETIALEIAKTFSGELQTSEPEGKARQIARGLKRVNPVSILTWELEVPAGEAREITYSYVVLVQR